MYFQGFDLQHPLKTEEFHWKCHRKNRSKFCLCFVVDFASFCVRFWTHLGVTLDHFWRLGETWRWFGETMAFVWCKIEIFERTLVALGAILVDLVPFGVNFGYRIDTICLPNSHLWPLSENVTPSLNPEFQSQYVDLNMSIRSPPRMRRSPRNGLNSIIYDIKQTMILDKREYSIMKWKVAVLKSVRLISQAMILDKLWY